MRIRKFDHKHSTLEHTQTVTPPNRHTSEMRKHMQDHKSENMGARLCWRDLISVRQGCTRILNFSSVSQDSGKTSRKMLPQFLLSKMELTRPPVCLSKEKIGTLPQTEKCKFLFRVISWTRTVLSHRRNTNPNHLSGLDIFNHLKSKGKY